MSDRQDGAGGDDLAEDGERPSPSASPEGEARKRGVLGGAYAALLGGAGVLMHGAVLLLITGLGQGPRSDADRLDAGLAALAIIPITLGALASMLLLWLGIAAIRDSRDARTGGAAGRLWMLFGVALLAAGYATLRSPSTLSAVATVLAAIGIWLNAKAWTARREAR